MRTLTPSRLMPPFFDFVIVTLIAASAADCDPTPFLHGIAGGSET
jgi:hypothetical protein